MSNRGVWATVDVVNGITGPALHLSEVASVSHTTAANQALMWNDAGILNLQGDAGVRIYDGLDKALDITYNAATAIITASSASTLQVGATNGGTVIQGPTFLTLDGTASASVLIRTTNSVYNRMIVWNGGSETLGSAISVGSATNNDTEAEAAAGISGPILNLARINSGTLTTVSNQTTIHNEKRSFETSGKLWSSTYRRYLATSSIGFNDCNTRGCCRPHVHRQRRRVALGRRGNLPPPTAKFTGF